MSDRVKGLLIVWALLIATIWATGPYVREILLTADEPRTVAPRGNLADFERISTELFEAAAPAVAYIFTEAGSRSPFDTSVPQGGAGSGFVWDGAGHVVTNFHVVQEADRIAVRLDSGEAIPATLIGAAPDYDLAVLKLATVRTGLTPIPVGRSADLKVGQAVFAIGNPFGLSRSLSTGVISALGRHLPTASGREIHGAIQTDTAINPGNSGGPLLDSAGRLIGVNTAIVSRSGSSAGVGFAVPVDVVNRVVPRLIKDGKFPRPGIGIATLDEEISARLGLPGIVIAEVLSGSSAEGAGLQGLDRRSGRLGDVITAVNGWRVQSIAEFAAVLEEAGIGSKVELTVVRDKRARTVKLRVMDIS
ncbi:MAG: trypsin-like peptidase domain-containing protein [Gammaproteobacteria bacterium]|nr:MAG: trypsin-like peptidase domain-containing protein [Gammaproteobacteria bacterium]